MKKKLLKGAIFLLLVFGCSKKQFICPAYNTYFIHDQNEREQMFSPFRTDSSSDEYYANNSSESVEVRTKTVTADLFWKGGGDKQADENQPKEDNNVVSVQNFDIPNSKYSPKQQNPVKKTQPGGLLTAVSTKNKMRNVTDIEMKVVMIKPLSKYSNVDSSSIEGQQTIQENVPENNDITPAEEPVVEKKKGRSSRRRKQPSVEIQSDTL